MKHRIVVWVRSRQADDGQRRPFFLSRLATILFGLAAAVVFTTILVVALTLGLVIATAVGILLVAALGIAMVVAAVRWPSR